MSKYLVIVEGIADAVFLRDCIFHVNKSTASFNKSENIDKFPRGKPTLISTSPEIMILNAGGCTQIDNYKNKIKEFISHGYKIIIIQDADNPAKDFGGFTERLKYLHNKKNELEIEFETFLFPNNKDDGDLEKLLLMIAEKSKFDSFLNCYDKYAKCIKSLSDDSHYLELMQDKYKVYNFCQVYCGMDLAKEENRYYNSPIWELSNVSINPLLSFLETIK